jgi:hypothetical protein
MFRDYVKLYLTTTSLPLFAKLSIYGAKNRRQKEKMWPQM